MDKYTIEHNIPIPATQLASKERITIRNRAKSAVKNAIRAGKLVKPLECSVCGATGRIVGHHADYHYFLDVIWCCETCHKGIHKNCEVIYVI